ncbi:hypothetical protein HBA54_04305 [Pelagibius litoralis]|uniref:Uncharacterized protein n=1 Tax=Pelagibius litoralis TaxID=374515 RepID=A0A967EX56_9PROT|nr:hypothetical protein [Pelagibius litoralis]NIA67805.1 hypothetical protein [Pelagibius litoralis]
MNKKLAGPVADLAQVKKDRERKAYNALVLQAWDELEHEDKREQRARKSDVERAGRQRL